ncbi:uncharacterized protein EDB93DRAFT_1251478 [Suillus bovinus]|uniref:uncharacterized protein n=1 Tax=Suillus bovinus TaxID=48563 RepID=UPI001B85E87D|nr:uncharacterized protein EDB93DRAFT_1251478 [Suillus bovinus]KAG2145380.1 hypothetical protein EDB93DRAFT_1251478 [Suillus bovinus]
MSALKVIAPSSATSKRPSSFSQPYPSQSLRMSLRRTTSFLSLSDYEGDEDTLLQSGPSSIYAKTQPPLVPYTRTLYHYKEQRERRKAALSRSRPEFTIAPPSTKQPIKSTPHPPPKQMTGLRTSSPLSPTQKLLPPRASFPRSKPEPDLYRIAIKARMRCSPEGAKILRMGPRMAVSILAATRDLEMLVSTQEVTTGKWLTAVHDALTNDLTIRDDLNESDLYRSNHMKLWHF